ncbi:plasma membrane proteolipid 3 [Fusarium longipes]|uniref:Plasma membrane proteolipid 3 n=1 Tax=Fusarium longipes TaxID=694270 RepID=A0A395SAK6_9HYPO|nr:plasma membrane proteolipid 3 [Fusarium longipes]
MPFTASDICKIILAIILPPVGVFLERGCGADFFINILLTILGYIPGIIHALATALPKWLNGCPAFNHRQQLGQPSVVLDHATFCLTAKTPMTAESTGHTPVLKALCL